MKMKQLIQELEFANELNDRLEETAEKDMKYFKQLCNEIEELKAEREEARVMRMEAESRLEDYALKEQKLLGKVELFHTTFSIQLFFIVLTLLVMIAILIKG